MVLFALLVKADLAEVGRRLDVRDGVVVVQVSIMQIEVSLVTEAFWS